MRGILKLLSRVIVITVIVLAALQDSAASLDSNNVRIADSRALFVSEEIQFESTGTNRTARHYSTHRYHAECGFRCKDGSCLKSQNRCDGIVQCGDASDEEDCSCSLRVGAAKRCDGYQDCPDGEDENTECSNACQTGEISCSTSKSEYGSHCIKTSQVCDGHVDCLPTKSDESECFKLSTLDPLTRGTVSYGVLQKKIGLEWYTVCKASSRIESQLLKKYAEKTCKILVGHANEDPKTKSMKIKDLISDASSLKYTTLKDQEHKFNETTTCSSKEVYYVTCPDPECGWPIKKFDQYYVSDREDSQMNFETTGTQVHRHYMYRRDVHGLTAKIVGGYDSQHGDWPFIVGIYRNGTFHCGGSILNKEWILTAAHCTHGFDKYVFEVQVGMLRRRSYSPKEQTRLVTEVIVHEKYDSKIFMNDIAMMKVSSPFYLSKYVTTACLPKDYSEDPEAGLECTVIGWGDLTEEGTGPDNLQEVKLPVLRRCLETFTKDALQICAGVLEGGKDACQGDSGGPLICTSHGGRHIVNGLVSFGRGCARKDQAGVYTRVSAYLYWIEKVLEGRTKPRKRPRSCTDKCFREGGECYFPKQKCDGVVHCLDATDETDCGDKHLSRARASSYDDADEEAYDHISKTDHATNEHTHEYGQSKLCGPTEFQCKTSYSCIPLDLKCNGNFDCKDETDEKNCECGDIVSNAYPELICDGLQHCLDGTDENDCYGNSKVCNGLEDHVVCPLSQTCIKASKWCDGVPHCHHGEDEIDCYRLMRSRESLPETEGFLEDKLSRGLQFGYVIKRSSGLKWRIACSDNFGDNPGETVCPHLGLSISSHVITRSKNTRDLSSSNSWREKRDPEYDESCRQPKAVCGAEPGCGIRKLYANSKHYTPKSTQVGAYPWVTMVLVEGRPVCPGTLVHKQWVLASSKCFDDNVRSFNSEYLSAITGFTKSTTTSTSTMEQVRRINSVVMLQSNLVLLRLESPVTTDHFTTPICASHTHGYHKLGNHLKCYRSKLINETIYDHSVTYDSGCVGMGHHCLKFDDGKCKKSTEYFVYCTEDHISWFMLGYASAESVSQCSDGGRLALENPFYGPSAAVTAEILNRPASSILKAPGCTGTRCPVGTCVGNKYVCDSIAHCPDRLDERRCQRMFQRLLRSHDEDENEEYDSSVKCPIGHFRCKVTGNCVPISAFCDNEFDCGSDDLTDEPDPENCNCRFYLELSAPEALCDPSGESRCPDRSDQLGCPCRPDSFVCDSSTSECIHQNLVCDSVKDCSNGYDEANCTALSSSVTHFKMAEYSNPNTLEGYALARVRGSWHLYCSDGWTQKLGMDVCGFLGFSTLESLETTNVNDIPLPDGEDDFDHEDAPYEEHEGGRRQLLVLHPQAQQNLDTGTIDDIAIKADPQQDYEYACDIAYLKCSNY